MTGVHCLRLSFARKVGPSNTVSSAKDLKLERGSANLNFRRYLRIIMAVQQKHPELAVPV
eukprot:jgi/Chlat1/8700/Chrsp88S09241